MKKITFILSFILLLVLVSCGKPPVTVTQGEHNQHEWTSWEIAQEASCIHEGIERRTCQICGEFEERSTPQTNHQYEMIEHNDGDCSQPGYERYHCRICGDTYEEKLSNTAEHDYYISNTVNPYCDPTGATYDGFNEYMCRRCGHTYQEILKKSPCEFVEADRIEPNCTTDGFIRWVCTVNPEHSYQEAIPSTGEHSFWYETYETYHIKRCYNCSYYIDSYVTVENSDGSTYETLGEYHNYGVWNIETPATCTKEGKQYKQCEDCNHIIYEVIPITHQFNNNGECNLCGDLKPTETLIFDLLGDGTYEVVGIEDNPDKIVVPNYHLGKKVTSIASYAFNNKEFTEIVLPTSITYYARYAFYGCGNLTNIYYHGKVEDWFNIEFDGSNGISTNTVYATPALSGRSVYFLNDNREYYKLTELVVPSSIKNIKDFTFAQFEQLTSITFHNSIESVGVGAFVNCDNLTSLDVYAKNIQAGAFGLCDKLTTVNLRNAVEITGTFFDCDELIDVTLPATLKVIGDSTFYDCLKLQTLILPEGLEKIDSGNFYNCDALTNISIPSTLTYFGRYNFDSCGNLEYNNIDGMYYLGNENNPKVILMSTMENEIENYTVDSDVKFIEYRAINAENMKTINIPSTVLGVNYPIINDPNLLEAIVTPLYGNLNEYFKTVPENLVSVELLSGTVYSTCFDEMNSLEEVIINDECVLDCHELLFKQAKLSKLIIPYITSETVNESLSSLVANYTDLRYLELTKAKVLSTRLFEYMLYIEEFIISESLERITGETSRISNIKLNELDNGYYVGTKTNPYYALVMVDAIATTFTILDDTKVIGQSAFNYCSNLEYTIYKNVSYVGDENNPFKYAVKAELDNLTKVEFHEDTEIIYETCYLYKTVDLEFGSSVKEIRSNFYQMGEIKSLYYNGSLSDWLKIKFVHKDSNPMISYDKVYTKENGEYKLLESIELDDSIKYIGDYQFLGYEFDNLKLPNDLEYVGIYSFAYTTINGKIDLGNLGTISENMFNSSKIKNIELSNYVVNISDSSFRNSTINELVIPESVKYIGKNAFDSCYIIPLVNMSAVEYIDEDAFRDTYITDFIFNGDVNDWLSITFNSLDSNPVRKESNVKFIKNNQEINLSNLVIENAMIIGNYQFARFNDIMSVSLPLNLKEIGHYAFYDLAIQEIALPTRLNYIGVSAFENCSNIKEVVIPNNVTQIGLGVFKNVGLESIELPFLGAGIDDNSENVIGYIFDDLNENNKDNHPYLESLEYVNVQYGEIGDYAFAYCKNLNTVDLGEQTTIGEYAFYDCRNLENIDLSDISSIGAYAFKYCTYFYDVYLSSDLRSIGEFAFDLEMNYIDRNVYFDGDVEDWCKVRLGDYRANPLCMGGTMYFMIDSKYTILEKIVVPNSINSLSQYIFAFNNDIKEIFIPSTVKNIGTDILYACNNVEKLTMPYLFERISNVFGDGINHMNGGKLSEVILLESDRTEIAEYAFSGMLSIQKFTLPNNITKISNAAFDGTRITEFIFTGTVEEWLNVELSWETSNPGNFGSDYYMQQNGEIKLLTELHLPESFISRSRNHFYNCLSIVDVYIPKFSTSVDFRGCVNIENVYYMDTIEQWICGTSSELAEGNPNYYGENFYVLKNGSYVKAPESIILPKDYGIIYYNLVGIENVKNVTIPKNITCILSMEGMVDLENIYYEGTVNEWLNMDHPDVVPQHNFYTNEDGTYKPLVNLEVDINSRDLNIQGIKTLESITFTKDVSVIYPYALEDLPNLKYITILNEDISFDDYYPIKNCPNIIYNEYENGYYIGNDDNPYMIFMGVIDKTVTEFIIHEDAVQYQVGCFGGCKNLKKITTPINIKGFMFFENDYPVYPENLEEVVFTKNIKIAYTDIPSLKRIVFKESIDEVLLSWMPFREPNLEEIIFEKDSLLKGFQYNPYEFSTNVKFNEYKNCYYLGNSNNPYMILVTAIDKTASTLEINSNTVSIMGGAFNNMNNITEVNIPDRVRIINQNAFVNCTSLHTITMKNVEYIGDYVFQGCVELTNLDLGEKLIEMGQYVFFDDYFPRLTKLKTLTLPNTLKKLNCGSLGGLTLDELIIPDSLESMHTAALISSNIKRLTIPFIGENKDHVVDITEMYINLNVLEYLHITNMTIVNQAVNLRDAEGLVTLIINAHMLESYAVRDLPNLKYLELYYDYISGKNIVANNNELLEVKLITTCDTIGEGMFSGCVNLTTINIPESTIIIAEYAFSNCDALEYLVIPESVSTIDSAAFYHVIKIFFESENAPADYSCPNSKYTASEWEYVDGVPTVKQVN